MEFIDKQIIKLFNRTELREGEHIIDNRDSTIAKELGLTKDFVSLVTSKYSAEKMESLNAILDIKRDEKSEHSDIIALLNSENESLTERVKEVESINKNLLKKIERLNNIIHIHEQKKPTNEIAKKRISIVKGLIRKGYTNIRAANSVGLSKDKSLQDLFKKFEGITINQYRKQLLNDGNTEAL